MTFSNHEQGFAERSVNNLKSQAVEIKASYSPGGFVKTASGTGVLARAVAIRMVNLPVGVAEIH